MVSHLTITASNTGAAAPKRQGTIWMSIMFAGVDRALKKHGRGRHSARSHHGQDWLVAIGTQSSCCLTPHGVAELGEKCETATRIAVAASDRRSRWTVWRRLCHKAF